ncbi:MAG: histidine phosphatase family protein [bacterium]|nr:histidine phosphatase family protein [bacterium]
MKIVVVPHGAKVTGVTQYPPELGADPPMTMEGKAKMLSLVPALKALGPYDSVYCSLMDRACGTMCTIVKQLGIKLVTCLEELGQYGNLDGDGTVIAYPGHENDNVITWQKQGLEAVQSIWNEVVGVMSSGAGCGKKVLVFTHRPILAGLVAITASVTEAGGIQKILDDQKLTGRGFRVFSCDGSNMVFGCNAGNLTLEV